MINFIVICLKFIIFEKFVMCHSVEIIEWRNKRGCINDPKSKNQDEKCNYLLVSTIV